MVRTDWPSLPACTLTSRDRKMRLSETKKTECRAKLMSPKWPVARPLSLLSVGQREHITSNNSPSKKSVQKSRNGYIYKTLGTGYAHYCDVASSRSCFSICISSNTQQLTGDLKQKLPNRSIIHPSKTDFYNELREQNWSTSSEKSMFKS